MKLCLRHKEVHRGHVLSLLELRQLHRVQDDERRGGLREVRRSEGSADLVAAPPGSVACELGSEAVVRLPPILFTRSAERSFTRLFGLPIREARVALRKMAGRTRIAHRPVRGTVDSPNAVFALVPDGVDVVFIAKQVRGIDGFVVVRVDTTPDDGEEDADEERQGPYFREAA